MTRERIAARIRTVRPSPDLYSLQAAQSVTVAGAPGRDRAIGSGLLKITELNTFVEAAYLTVLGRPADADGRRHYLEHLARGSLTRAHVLRAMQLSPEGRASSIRVKGSRARLLMTLAALPTNSRPHRLAMTALRLANRLTARRLDT